MAVVGGRVMRVDDDDNDNNDNNNNNNKNIKNNNNNVSNAVCPLSVFDRCRPVRLPSLRC